MNLARKFLPIVAVNCLIALWLMLLGGPGDLVGNLLISNAIGFSIWGLFRAACWWMHGRRPHAWLAFVFVPLGVFFGAAASAWIGIPNFVNVLWRDPTHGWRLAVGNLAMAAFVTACYSFFYRAEALRADLESERRRAAETLQSETTARLALLQAQIEPHFLFNTLANVQSVIESNPAVARSMLEHLNLYLRASLGRSRRLGCTLAEELELVEALLAIWTLRLGSRLRYSVDVPAELRGAALPPLLLQPLVENALKHGIEPAVEGGEIRIEADANEATMRLKVLDTGVGINPASPEGVGLSNVRARLAGLYGEKGRVAMYANTPRGVICEMILPLAQG